MLRNSGRARATRALQLVTKNEVKLTYSNLEVKKNFSPAAGFRPPQ